jgi:hypothetical protein
MRFPERKPSANFCFVIDIPGLAPFSALLWHEVSPNLSKRRQFNTSKAGGQQKGSSKLAESERVDVQKKIAAAGRCFCRTLSHALEVLSTGDPEIVRALCNGDQDR